MNWFLKLKVLVLFFLFSLSSGHTQEAPQAQPTQLQHIESKSGEILVPASKEQVQLSFSSVVKRVAPAVVNIYAAKVTRSRSSSPFFDDPIFRHFFGDAFPQENPHARIQNSLGSGVLVRADGIVVTNHHVVDGADEIKVVLADGREFAADLVSKDARTDLAALKIKRLDKESLPFLELRDADELEVGDVVLAVGNPFGIGQTVTMGIISGLARTQVGVDDFRSLIQTDAAINPGNSGGPLVTLDGRIVGINTAIFSNTGGSIGIGFAIPSNLLVPIISSVDRGGKIQRIWLGISMQDVDAEIANSLGLSKPSGVIIKSIYQDSPATKQDLQVGDIILEINDHEIKNEAAYRFRLAAFEHGQKAKIKIFRKGSILLKEINLEAPPDYPQNKPLRLVGRHPLSGAVVISLSPAVASELAVGFRDGGGVIILSISPGSPASFGGFLPGDVILEINGHGIKSSEELNHKLARAPQGWEILSKRGEKTRRLHVNTR